MAGKEEGIKDVLDKISSEITATGAKVETVQKMDKKAFSRIADKKYTAGFEVSGKIKRSDFGVKTYVPLIGDDVDLIISAGFEHK